jgi:hypothetical protein
MLLQLVEVQGTSRETHGSEEMLLPAFVEMSAQLVADTSALPVGGTFQHEMAVRYSTWMTRDAAEVGQSVC